MSVRAEPVAAGSRAARARCDPPCSSARSPASRAARSRSSSPAATSRRFGAGPPVAARDPRRGVLPAPRDARQARPRRVLHRGRVGRGRPRRALRAPPPERRRGGRARTRGAPAARAAPPPAPAQRARPRAPQHRLPLRPRQRALRADARRDDDLLLRRLRAPDDVARRGAAGEVRAAVPSSSASAPATTCSRSAAAGAASRATQPTTRGCRVTGLTISRRAGRVRARADRAGCRSRSSNRTTGRVEGRFTKVVSVEMIEAIGADQFGDLLRDDRPRARAGRPRGRPVDPRPGPALGSLPPHAGLDRALRVPGLPDPVARGADPRGSAPLAARDLRGRRDRRALRRDAPPLAGELPRAPRRGARGSATTAASSGPGTSTSPSARRPSGCGHCATRNSCCARGDPRLNTYTLLHQSGLGTRPLPWPTRIRIVVGEPITVEPARPTIATARALTERLEQAVIAA